MHSDAFDRYHHGHSPLHDLDPRIKVIVTVAFILSNALLPDGAWIAFGLAWLLILFANYVSGLGIRFTFKRSFIALPFALAAITVLFSIPVEPERHTVRPGPRCRRAGPRAADAAAQPFPVTSKSARDNDRALRPGTPTPVSR